jgi:uncharacterized protein with PQ loop repeat
MTWTDGLGWSSSLVLFATLAAQIHKQWASRSARGVSPWLFVGQACASFGFTAYSVLVENWVFTLTNAVLAAAALLGTVLTLRFRAREPSAER